MISGAKPSTEPVDDLWDTLTLTAEELAALDVADVPYHSAAALLARTVGTLDQDRRNGGLDPELRVLCLSSTPVLIARLLDGARQLRIEHAVVEDPDVVRLLRNLERKLD